MAMDDERNRAAAGRAGGVVTFVLTDIEGSSRHWEAHPDEMPRALAIHDRVVEACVRAHGGTVLTNHDEGDSFFAVFPLPTQAVAAACTIQQELAMQPWPQHLTPLVRMAIHTGEAAAADYRGRVPNRCSRVRGFARGGQVLLTAATAELVQDSLPPGARLVDLGEHGLRALPLPVRIFELIVPPADASRSGGARHTLEEIHARLADLAPKAGVVMADLVEEIEHQLHANPCDRLTKALSEGNDLPALHDHVATCPTCGLLASKLIKIDRVARWIPSPPEGLRQGILAQTGHRKLLAPTASGMVGSILAATGWTHVRLIHELRRMAMALGEPAPIGLDVVTVNRWLRGRQTPSAYHRRLLIEISRRSSDHRDSP
jgi:class 3 adenylate cyclase